MKQMHPTVFLIAILISFTLVSCNSDKRQTNIKDGAAIAQQPNNPPVNPADGVRRIFVLDPVTMQQADDGKNRWRSAIVNSPTAIRINDVLNINGIYISKLDLMNMLYDDWRNTDGVMIEFGFDANYDDDNDPGTAAKRRLIPYVSSARLNQTNSAERVKLYGIAKGCPGECVQ